MITIMFDEFPVPVRAAVFSQGDTIFRRGDAASAVYQVKAGHVAMVRFLEDGAEVAIARAGPGETFAEAAMFAEVYHCDAVARTPCELSVYSTSQIRDWMRGDAAAGPALAAFFARQVRELRTRVELLRIKRAPDRVLAWLQLKARGAPGRVERSGAWVSAAAEIGLTPEAFYRALASLQRSGQIKRTRGAIELRPNRSR